MYDSHEIILEEIKEKVERWTRLKHEQNNAVALKICNEISQNKTLHLTWEQKHRIWMTLIVLIDVNNLQVYNFIDSRNRRKKNTIFAYTAWTSKSRHSLFVDTYKICLGPPGAVRRLFKFKSALLLFSGVPHPQLIVDNALLDWPADFESKTKTKIIELILK